MAGEHIEDMKIDLIGWDNDKLEANCNMLPSEKSNT